MRVIARNTLVAFHGRHPECRASLERWLGLAEKAQWQKGADVVATFSGAKNLNAERVRFEVHGGNYRMVVAFHFRLQIAYIKFLGTHAEYDAIDPMTVSQF